MARLLLLGVFSLIAGAVYAVAGWQYSLIIPIVVGAIIVQRAWLWCGVIGLLSIVGLFCINAVIAFQPIITILNISAEFIFKKNGLGFVLPIVSSLVLIALFAVAGLTGSLIRRSMLSQTE